MTVTKSDRETFRKLVSQYREVAFLDVHRQTMAAWRRSNSLDPARPMIMIDQLPWTEIAAVAGGELDARCVDPLLRSLEQRLRCELYKWRNFPGDMTFFPWLGVPKVFTDSGIGVSTQHHARDAGHDDAQTHTYADQIPDLKAIERLHAPLIRFDAAATAERERALHDLVGDIIPVKMTGISIWAAVWDRIVFWRGAEKVLWDLADRPDHTHALMKKLMAVEMAKLDQLEAQNLLDPSPATVHCTGAFTDELPAAGFDPGRVRAKDCWVSGAAQIFSEVSPAMHDEFEIEYLKPYYERFGLVNYGCCEPLHNKIDLVRKISNVRSVSVSPWADVQKAAERLGRTLIMLRKSNPSHVALDVFDETLVADETRKTLAACRQSGTPVQFILKDITTVRGEPRRLAQWEATVRRTIAECWN